MKIYQRFLSRSLMFFSILLITFVLLLETNIGFKWIFNFANRFFIEFKVEKISGNWRDFLLKNIQYDILGFSIRADSVHVILDTKSLFKISTVFKDIQIKNLIVLLNDNTSNNISNNNNISNKNVSNNISKKNILIKYPMIFQKIHVDKFFFRSSQINVLFFNILTGIQLINNDILFLPTYINNINLILPHVTSSKIIFKKNNTIKPFNLMKKLNHVKKIYSFLKYCSNTSQVCVPFNIDLQYLQCNTIKIFHNKNFSSFQIALQAKIKDKILDIKTIKINSNILRIKSFGKIIFHNNSSISSLINNKIIIPKLNNKSINIVFKSYVNKKFIFTLQSKYLYKFKIHGSVLLNDINHPFNLKLDSYNLFWPVKNKYFLKFINLNACIKGQRNNYLISLKNKFVLRGLPTIFFHVEGQGNLKNIFLKRLQLFPMNIKNDKTKKSIIDNLKYNKNILKLIGKMNIFTNNYNNTTNLYIPKINLDLKFMKKKLAILGSFYYRNNNILNIPKINFSIGKNKLFLKGFIGQKYNIYSSIYANHLNYFYPNLKGKITAQAKLYGNNMLSILTGKILAANLYTNRIHINNVKIFTNMNVKNIISGNFLLDAKKISFYDTYINNLRIQTYFHNYEQHFDFLLKSKNFYINFTINGIFNKQTGIRYSLLKTINIRTCLGQVNFQNIFAFNYYNINDKLNNFYKNSMKQKERLSSIFYNKKLSSLDIFNKPFINFRSNLFIKGYLKSFLRNGLSNGKIFLTGTNIELEKNQNKKIFLEKIDLLKLSINLVNNTLKSKWMIKKIKKSSKNDMIFGYLNIINIYHQKNINGKCYFINFPISFLNFFSSNNNAINGLFSSKIKFFGTIYQPKILADINLQDIYIKSNNILKYITLFFPYLPKKIHTIKINQEITIKKGKILFKLYPSFQNNYPKTEWHLIFNSNKISMFIFSKIQVKFSSYLNLHYLLSQYDLMGFIKLPFFCFKINEKNFIF
ncbi:hypothetical protein [Buchnera aphidicola]|uniref:Conserved protein n=1 Tax=Buchnera aphidicola str. Ua (Uroleucon ambrosiae) TaxID=1005057 RepID=G2LNX2_BUCUM|nr:hypothetical protein [Buchnera aphidicola]AEO07909.1 conserved protein [Buchnera aphidicola str. Ua (Uroleucon ambrosiae)]